jgi:nicotinamidase-related amidase
MDARAVLLVDLQNDINHPDGGLADTAPIDRDPLLASVRALVSWAHAEGIPVIWTRLAFRPGHFDAVPNSISRRRGTLLDGTWGAELLEGLGRDPSDIVVTKKRPSAFFDTDLALVLRSLRVRRLVVAGGATNWAVESTVRDAHSHDFDVVVARDATGSFDAELHEASLRSMGAIFARISTVAEIMASP